MTDEALKEGWQDAVRKCVQNDSLRATKSRNAITGIYVTRLAAAELAGYGIRVTQVYPVPNCPFYYGSYNFAIDTRLVAYDGKKWTNSHGNPTEAWSAELIDGAKHLELTSRAVDEYEASKSAAEKSGTPNVRWSSLNPTPVDAATDAFRGILGRDGNVR